MNIIDAKTTRAFLENYYDYETSHVDAADAYSVLFDEHSAFNLDTPYAVFRFSTQEAPEGYKEAARISLYGQEMECQLPAPAPLAVREYIADVTDWYIPEYSPDLAYTPYPQIDVICYLPEEA